MGPVLQYTGQWPPDALHLHIYPGDGESLLYEDDGHSMAYRSGEFQISRFACRTSGDGALSVRRQVEGPFQPGYERFEIQIHGLPAPPRQVLADGQPLGVAYDGETRTARLSAGPWSELRIL
jgi:alpha-glucosidase